MVENDYLVIGAGMAGLAFAREVKAAGATVQLLDKGRGVGGRAATRRFAGTRVDHGAQFFTVRDPAFQAVVDQGLADGWIRPWFHSVPEWRDGALHDRPDGHPRYACPDGMSALPKFLAQGLTVHTEAQVQSVARTDSGYVATCADGRSFTGTSLILNLPPDQIQALLPLPALAPATLEPCWALLVALETDLTVDWPALELTGHPVFSWLSRDHTKRPAGSPPTLVAHASPAWTQAHLEHDKESATAALLAALGELVGPLSVREAQAHRWRYAKPKTALGAPYYWDSPQRLGACGDWCEGGRVEGAFLSGYRLAKTGIARSDFPL